MIKLVSSFGMKVPADVEYSSRSYHVGLESEVADGIGGEGILAKAKELFALAKAAVNSELNGKSQPSKESPKTSPARNNDRVIPDREQENGRASGNGDSPSGKQLGYLLSLARKNGGIQKLNAVLRDEYGIEEMNRLTRKECSELIERMKGGANARR